MSDAIDKLEEALRAAESYAGQRYAPIDTKAANEYARLCDAAYGFITTALAIIPEIRAQMEWQPIETAPYDEDVLVYWPQHALGDDDCPTDEIVGGVQLVSQQMIGSSGYHGSWDEPEWISGHGSHMDDDWCWAQYPTHWMPLPPAPQETDNAG